MSRDEQLRSIVADVAGVEPASIGPDYPLNVPKLRNSIGIARMESRILREFGVRVTGLRTVQTFEQLQTALERAVSSLAARSATAPVAAPSRPPVAAHVQVASQSVLVCGIDIERPESLPVDADPRSAPFYQDHFTAHEIDYCMRQADPRQHFAARWCVKEALRKTGEAWLHVPMNRLSIDPVVDAPPVIRHHGADGTVTVLPFSVSLAHMEGVAVAVVVGYAAAERHGHVLRPIPTECGGKAIRQEWVAWGALALSVAAILLRLMCRP